MIDLTESQSAAMVFALRVEVARARRWMRFWVAVSVLLAAALAGALAGLWRQV